MEAVAHWIGHVRPSLFAYQFVVVAVADPAMPVASPAQAAEVAPS
jgi:hypothetical protein